MTDKSTPDAQLLVDVAQILDGWKQADPTNWTEFDESVRQRVSSALAASSPGREQVERYRRYLEVSEADNSAHLEASLTALRAKVEGLRQEIEARQADAQVVFDEAEDAVYSRDVLKGFITECQRWASRLALLGTRSEQPEP